jgi:hypothetical protein
MEVKTYMFEVRGADGKESAGVKNGAPEEGAVKTSSPGETQSAALQGFGKSIANGATTMALSPLNTATGGLASPVFNVGKALVTGASAGAVGGAIAGVVMAGVNLAIRKISERMDRLEAEAQNLNNHDNVLIRGGFKADATYYDAKFFSGVEKVER